nr:hypothetical protein BaRGS_013615 [Batillaria attramentaria]
MWMESEREREREVMMMMMTMTMTTTTTTTTTTVVVVVVVVVVVMKLYLSTGKSVLLDSKDPDVCYVRDIPKEEMAKHAKDCAGDHAAQKDDATADVGKTYVDGKELVEADLSDRLAEACEGRRLVALVQIVTAVGGTTCTPYKDCEQVCVKEGWWFRSGQCKRYEKMCDQKESCSRTTTTTCD